MPEQPLNESDVLWRWTPTKRWQNCPCEFVIVKERLVPHNISLRSVYPNYTRYSYGHVAVLAELLRQLTANQEQVKRLANLLTQAGLGCFMRDGTPEQVAAHMQTVAQSHLDKEKELESQLAAQGAEITKLKADFLKSPSQICSETHVQNCQFCERMDCCDNTSDAKKQIAKLKALLQRTIDPLNTTMAGIDFVSEIREALLEVTL